MSQSLNSPPLPMFGGAEQCLRRGSAGASSTNVPTKGLHAAQLNLFRSLIAVLTTRAAAEIPVAELLDAQPLIAVAERRLANLDELSDPGAATSEVQNRLTALKHVRTRKPVAISREARAIVQEVVDERIRSLIQLVERAVCEAPSRAKEILEGVRFAVDNMSLSDPNIEPISRFDRAAKAMSIRQEYGSGLAKSSLEFLQSHLRQGAIELFNQSRRVMAHELVNEALRVAGVKLRSFVDEMALFAARFSRRVEVLRQGIEERHRLALDGQDYSRASVICELPGKTESEVLSGMIERAQLPDRHSFVVEFVERLQAVLQEEVSTEADTSVKQRCLGQLLVQLAPERILDLFEKLFEESLGTGHSLYEIVEQFGIEKLVDDLLQRAEPLCHLNQRDIEAFNVTPAVHTVVRLPVPIGPRDREIRSSLEGAFLTALRGSMPPTILDSAPGERDAISVVTAKVGWPLLIEAGNLDLLLQYAKCERLGHFPHLIGILPEAPQGAVIDSYVELANRIQSSHVAC